MCYIRRISIQFVKLRRIIRVTWNARSLSPCKSSPMHVSRQRYIQEIANRYTYCLLDDKQPLPNKALDAQDYSLAILRHHSVTAHQ